MCCKLGNFNEKIALNFTGGMSLKLFLSMKLKFDIFLKSGKERVENDALFSRPGHFHFLQW